MVRLLLERGGDANFRGFNGRSPILTAVAAENEEVVRLLAENPAEFGHVEFVSVLAESGAD